MTKAASMIELEDDLEERKDKKNIENNQIFSNVLNSEFKKKSQKTFEFFKSLKSSNICQKTFLKGQLGDPPRI